MKILKKNSYYQKKKNTTFNILIHAHRPMRRLNLPPPRGTEESDRWWIASLFCKAKKSSGAKVGRVQVPCRRETHPSASRSIRGTGRIDQDNKLTIHNWMAGPGTGPSKVGPADSFVGVRSCFRQCSRVRMGSFVFWVIFCTWA